MLAAERNNIPVGWSRYLDHPGRFDLSGEPVRPAIFLRRLDHGQPFNIG